MTYGSIHRGYNRHDVACYYKYQRGNMLGWDIYGNVQRFGHTPYWGGHDSNKNVNFQAALHEVTSPEGPLCAGNLVASRVGNVNWCVRPVGRPALMPDVALWAGRANTASGYYASK